MLHQFYDRQFENETAERLANAENKGKLEKLIIRVYNDPSISSGDKEQLKKDVLLLLAKNTGCAEDSEIAEAILNELTVQGNILTQPDIDFFYDHAATRRWD